MIRLGLMRMHNFGIYKGTVELDFTGKDIVGILAEYDENPNRSNRSGKCFGPDTPIRMFDGNVKMVQAIKNGEQVIGPDSKPRNVYGVTSGKEEMFLIKSNDSSIEFRCNKSHILTLKTSCRILIQDKSYQYNDVINLSVREYLKLSSYKNTS